MKKYTFLVCMLYAVLCLPGKAVNYCASSSWGYAGSVTGGGSTTPTLVKSESELKNAMKSSNKVIIITKSITLSGQISTDKSNLTIMALPGVKLVNTTQTKEGSGIFYLKGSNIILRNLTFEGPGAFDCDGKDNLTLDGAKNIWVDHCDFQDAIDGNFDIKGFSDNITVSWCRFRYLKAPKPREAGDTDPDHTDDHRFSNLIGSSSSDKPADGVYNITYAFCWWDEGCKQRMTRCRNALIHYLNCYWNSSVADYYVGPENVSSYFEGCTFAGKANSAKNIYKGFNSSTNYCKFVNCTGNLPSNSGTVNAPSYSYDALSAATAKNYVTNSTCGTGATLTITNTAEVSSSCDSGDTPIDPTPVVVDGNCCVDLSLGEVPTVSNKGIPAEFGNLSIIVNLVKGKWEQGFLNMGGNADYITFDFSAYNAIIKAVEFDVTIPLWEAAKNTIAYHWNNEANSTYNISSSEKEMVSLAAPANAKSFTIQRSAGTSTRISQVCFEVKNSAASVEAVMGDGLPVTGVRKILRNGQLYLMYKGTMYDVRGRVIGDW